MLVATIALALLGLNGQKPPFDVRASDTGLLQNKAVQQELKLSTDQITRINAAEDAYRAEAKRTHSWDSDREHVAVTKCLNASQLKRLREISMQNSGPIVLIVDFVAERIGAGPARQKQIMGVFNSSINEQLKPMEKQIDKMVDEEMKSAGGDPKEIERHSDAIEQKASKISESVDHDDFVKKAAQKILGTLTPSEKKAWQDLQGTPFPLEQLKDRGAAN